MLICAAVGYCCCCCCAVAFHVACRALTHSLTHPHTSPLQVTVTSAGESWAIHFDDVNSAADALRMTSTALLKTIRDHPHQKDRRLYSIVHEGEGDDRKPVLVDGKPVLKLILVM
jgi:hypothetical protein